MKKSFTILILVFIVFLAIFTRSYIMSGYTWDNKYANEWSLADKSSTILAKQEHLDKFIQSLDRGKANGDFAKYDAIFLKTPNNNFDQNLNALKTLQDRLKSIQDMDPNSFEYNTAIQQITQQEQGEANEMIDNFYGCYTLNNYPVVWGWIGTIIVGVIAIMGTIILIVLPVLILE